jgi:hypothetical protein
MAPKKNPEEELKDAAARREIDRPERTRCESCDIDFGTPLALLRHARTAH